jgi:hypothetical protein
VVLAVRHGLLSQDLACERYCLTPEELAEWERWESAFGVRGIQSSKLKHFRAALAKRQEGLVGTCSRPHDEAGGDRGLK